MNVNEIRHVHADRGHVHLVTISDADTAFCGQGVAGLRPAGDPLDGLNDAAKLGAWVNLHDRICPDCREAFNTALFEDE